MVVSTLLHRVLTIIIIKKKGGFSMPTEKERLDVLKSMAFDLLEMFEADPEKTYTVEELKKLLSAYIKGAQQ